MVPAARSAGVPLSGSVGGVVMAILRSLRAATVRRCCRS
jgi:hypothetical protein